MDRKITNDCWGPSSLSTTEDAIEALIEAKQIYGCKDCYTYHPAGIEWLDVLALLKRDTPIGCAWCMHLFSNMEALQEHDCPDSCLGVY